MSKRHGDSGDNPGGTLFHFITRPDAKKGAMLLLVLSIGLFGLLTVSYPYPIHCLPDASGYLHAAVNHWKINYRPYGYPAFLNLIYGMNRRIGFIAFSQYVLYVTSMALFIFTLKYYFSVTGRVFYGLIILCVVSPVSLYYTHYAISDSVFSSLTILWITTGIWLLSSRKTWIVVVHLGLMLAAIHVRYAGLIYPLLTALLFILAFRKDRIWKKILFPTAPVLIMLLYYNAIAMAVQRETGVKTFTGFSGWSMANNGTMIIPYINLDKQYLNDREIRFAHHFVKQYPDSTYRYSTANTTEFIWSKGRAGKAFLKYVVQQNICRNYFSAWVYTGTLWGKYGNLLMREYPWQYFRHFIVPNIGEILYPSRVYLLPGNAPVTDLIKKRYNISATKLTYRWDVLQPLQGAVRVGNLILWIVVVAASVFFLIRHKRLLLQPLQKNIIVFSLITIYAYTAFIAISHVFELRYVINIQMLRIAVPLLVFHAGYNALVRKTSLKK